MNAKHNDIWIIGDLQGCLAPLEALLAHPDIAGNPESRLWFAGDMVNRGPDSLGALRKVKSLGKRAICVLGNHDLHLLAVAAGAGTLKKSDTLRPILDAPDADELLDWLRRRPLAHYEQGHLMVHAGVFKTWNTATTLALAAEAHEVLAGPDWKSALGKLYGNTPDIWDDALRGDDRLRAIINILTRMRMCDAQGRLEFSHKGAPGKNPGIMPWFDVPGRAMERSTTIVFGHWSTLGLMVRPDAICLDTGCIWGRQLTAMRLRDHGLVDVPCPQRRRPGKH